MGWFFRKSDRQHKEKEAPKAVEATLADVRKAIRAYESQLPEGVTRAVLVGSDHEVRFELLAHELGGIPVRKYYMSRKTYELFEEPDREYAVWTDLVQTAVDEYMSHEHKAPVVADRPDMLIDIHLLHAKSYLHEVPPMPFYLTTEEFMVSHRSRQRES